MKHNIKRALALFIALLLAAPTFAYAEEPRAAEGLVLDATGDAAVAEGIGNAEVEIPEVEFQLGGDAEPDDPDAADNDPDAAGTDPDATVMYCFIVEDMEYASQTARDGEEILRPADPDAPEGMAFDDWYAEDGMPLFADRDGDGSIDAIIAHPDGFVTVVNVEARFVKGEATQKPSGEDEDGEATQKPSNEDKDDETTQKPSGEDKDDEATQKPSNEDKDDETTQKPSPLGEGAERSEADEVSPNVGVDGKGDEATSSVSADAEPEGAYRPDLAENSPQESFPGAAVSPEGKSFGDGEGDEATQMPSPLGEGAERSEAEEVVPSNEGNTDNEKEGETTSSVSADAEPEGAYRPDLAENSPQESFPGAAVSPEGEASGNADETTKNEKETTNDEATQKPSNEDKGDEATQKPSPLGEGAERSEAEEVVPSNEGNDDDEVKGETTSSVSADAEPEGAYRPDLAENSPLESFPGAAVSPQGEAFGDDDYSETDLDSTAPDSEENTTDPDPDSTDEDQNSPSPDAGETLDPTPFCQSRTVNGVVVTVTAEAGAFPAGAELVVDWVPVFTRAYRDADAAVEALRDEDQNVAASYTFDIRVLDPGTKEELQPAEGYSVQVSFALAEVADQNLDTNVYHITEDGSGELSAEALDVSTEITPATGEATTATVETDGFSLYTVEFTYNTLEYVLPGGERVALSEILNKLGLTGTPTAVEVSDDSLFDAALENGEWIVSAKRAFSSTEWMKVTLNGVVYGITVTDDQSVTYLDEKGESHTVTATVVDSNTLTWTDKGSIGGGIGGSANNGIYAVTSNVTITKRVEVSGDVKLILCDGAKLIVQKGISVPSNASLTIYGQQDGSGKLFAGCIEDGTVKCEESNAGIGGNIDKNTFISNYNAGTITINGGVITAKGGKFGAGIGGACKNADAGAGNGAIFTINRGTVTAVGGKCCAGIGGARTTGNQLTFKGGKVEATGGDGGAGIGGGWGGNGGIIKVTGSADISATGGDGAAGIGGGWEGNGLSFEMTGGKITLAQGGSKSLPISQTDNAIFGGAGIGGGAKGNGGEIDISGGKIVLAQGGLKSTGDHKMYSGAGIGGGGSEGASGNIQIHGDAHIVSAKGDGGGAGIGGGYNGDGDTIEIYGNAVIEEALSKLNEFGNGAGIGGGAYGNGGTIKIYGNAVIKNAECQGKNSGGTGIGGGIGGDSGAIEIGGNADIQMAKGGALAAGIGGGHTGNGENITITGGKVHARGGAYGAAIGGGKEGKGGTITISGGQVLAGDVGGNITGIGSGINKRVSDATLYLSYTDENADTMSLTGEIYVCNVIIADGCTFCDKQGRTYSGTLDADERNLIKDKTIVPAVKHALSIAGGIEHGTVTADPSGDVLWGQTVTLTVTPDDSYALSALAVSNGTNAIETKKVNKSTYTFTMPAANVTVTAKFIEGHVHDGITFLPTDKLPDEEGDYCLTDDVTLDSVWEAPSGTTRICLNGHKISTGGCYLSIASGVALDIYEDDGKSGSITSSDDMAVFIDGGGFTLRGGTIQGKGDGYGSGAKDTGVEASDGSSFIMAGGTVTGFNRTGVYVHSESTFSISGAPVISGNTNDGKAANVFLESGATITVTGKLTDTNKKIGVLMQNPGEFTTGLSGNGGLSNFTSDDPAYGVRLTDGGEAKLGEKGWAALQDDITAAGTTPTTFKLSDYADANKKVTAKDTDTALTVAAGQDITLDLNGCKLDRGNPGSGNGCEAVTVKGTLTVKDGGTGGVITGGTDNAVYVDGGDFTLEGGEITGNSAPRGGGVYVYSDSTLTMKGGRITGNSAQRGGGVYVDNSGTLTMMGGAITGNTASLYAGGVYVQEKAAFSVKGGVDITGNVKGGTITNGVLTGGDPNNVFLNNSKPKINVTGSLAGASIGVNTDGEFPFVFTTGLKNNGDASNFTSDDATYAVSLTDDGEAHLTDLIVSYADPAGVTANLAEYAAVSDQTAWGEADKATWYAVTADATLNSRVTVAGDVNLVLCDGTLLTAVRGITVSDGNSLTVWAGKVGRDQTPEGTGTLYAGTEDGTKATCDLYNAGIGGNGDKNASGGITVNGGVIYAYGGAYGAGIGGGDGYNGGGGASTIAINGGNVEAHGGNNAAGIGTGDSGRGGTIAISGGAVVAIGGSNAAAIGTGTRGYVASITISGEATEVTAKPSGRVNIWDPESQYAAGIGSGDLGSVGTITITGGTVNAQGSKGAPGIGAGGITGGSPQRDGDGVVGRIEITGGSILSSSKSVSNGGEAGPGIGCGFQGKVNEVVIGGSATVTATAGYNGYMGEDGGVIPAIGASKQGTFGTLELYDTARVWAGADAASRAAISAWPDGRADACMGNVYAKIAPCTHATSSDIWIDAQKHYNINCLYCLSKADEAAHKWSDFAHGQVCDTCGALKVDYINADGTAADGSLRVCMPIDDTTSDSWNGQNGVDGWYAVPKKTSNHGIIIVEGDVNLVLCDGAELDIPDQIRLSDGASLTVWAQSAGDDKGVLVVFNDNGDNSKHAGIDGGSVTIHGGKIIAKGGKESAGIGGGRNPDGGSVVIDGGEVRADGGKYGAGIGGGKGGSGGTITISGGTVTATGGIGGAGIGGGQSGTGGEITINGGQINATGSANGAGIGDGADAKASGTITLGWTDATRADMSVTANSYSGAVKLANDFQIKKDDGTGAVLDATGDDALAEGIQAAIAAKTLVPLGTAYAIGTEFYPATPGATVAATVDDIPVTKSAAGSMVKLTLTPTDDYSLARVATEDGVKVNSTRNLNTGVADFTMPAGDVTATYTAWAKLQDRITLAVISGGTVTLDRDYTASPADTCLYVYGGETVTIDLNGHVIDRAMTTYAEDGCVIWMQGASSAKPAILTVKDSAPGAAHDPAITYKDPITGEDVAVAGGVITGGKSVVSCAGGGVHMESSSTFTLEGGAIAGNATTDQGGGVFVDSSASFTMKGGAIRGNQAKWGGGIRKIGNGEVNIEGGEVSGNTAHYGGGVYTGGANTCFKLTDGSITGNVAEIQGGGVLYGSAINSAFAMTGGEISGNRAGEYGGGLAVDDDVRDGQEALFELSGGSITGNAAGTAGGGVFMGGDYANTALKLSGAPVITDNTADGADSNVHLKTGKVISVTGALQQDAQIGVTTEAKPQAGASYVTLTDGYQANPAVTTPRQVFTSDDAACEVDWELHSGEAVLGVPVKATATDYEGNYNGKAHGITVKVTAPESGATVAYSKNEKDSYQSDPITFTDVAEASSSSPATVYFRAGAEGYVEARGSAKVVIKPLDVTVKITGHSASVTYDGAEHVAEDYDFKASSKLYNDSTYFVYSGDPAEARRTDAGTTHMGLKAEQFSNTNLNFNATFKVEDGYVTIQPLDVEVTITGHANTAIYDGKSHGVTGYDVVTSTPLYKASDFTFTGSASAAQTGVGTAYMGLTAGQFVDNGNNPNLGTVTFTVKQDGYQKIMGAAATVTIIGANNVATYDGAAHGVNGYTVQIDNPVYAETDFTFSGEAAAARTDVGTTDMGLAEKQFANDNPNFESVTFNVTDGYQRITPAAITIAADDKVSQYGKKTQDLSYQIGGAYVDGDELGVTLSTAATEASDVGPYPIVVAWNGNANYDAKLIDGAYTITKGELSASASGYSGVYDGAAHGITVNVSVEGAKVYYGTSELTADNYATAGSTTPPTYSDAGSYTVYYWIEAANREGVGGSKTVEILKASGHKEDLTDAQKPTARNTTYTGEALALVNAPASLPEGYTGVQYSADGGATWSDAIPTATDAGSYAVQVKYVGDKNHNDMVCNPVTSTIAKADGDVSKLTDAQKPTGKELTYNDAAQPLVNAPASLPKGYTKVQYSADGGATWSDAIPTATDAGSYAVQVKYVGDKNHNDMVGDSVTSTIAKADGDVSKLTDAQKPTGKELTYNDAAQPLVAAPLELPKGYTRVQYSADGGATWSDVIPTATDAGSCAVQAKYVGDRNHNDMVGDPVTSTIAKADGDVSKLTDAQKPTGKDLTYNDAAQPLVAAPLELPKGYTRVQYSADGGKTWSDAIPTTTDVGTHTVLTKYVGDKNHNDMVGDPVSATIAKADGDVSKLTDAQKPTGKDLTYNDAAQPLVAAPLELSKGYTKVQYSADGGATWSDAIPTATDAGSYAVKVKYVGDRNHNDMVGDPVTSTIAKADGDVSKLTDAQKPTGKELTYNDAAQPLVVAPLELPKGYTGVQYSADGGATWSDAIPTATDVGTYTVLTKYVGDRNHNDMVGDPVTSTIAEQKVAISKKLVGVLRSTGDTSLELAWMPIADVNGYDVFYGKCGTNKYKLAGTVETGEELSLTLSDLKAHRCYKAYIKAWVWKNGKKTYAKKSPVMHCYTGGGAGKKVNPGVVSVKDYNMTVKLGKTGKIKPSVTGVKPGNVFAHNAKWRYYSTDTRVAKVNSSGKVTAVGPGSCEIYVLATNGAHAIVNVTVDARPRGMAFTKKELTLKLKANQKVTAKLGKLLKLTPKKAVAELTWSSGNEDVATVDAEGVVTATGKGKTTITVACGQKRASIKVAVS